MNLPSNIWKWLEPLKTRKPNENVAPASYEVYRRVKDNSDVELPDDVLRHSFASNAYYFLGIEHTIDILGHIGGYKVLENNYKGLSDAKTAKEYFKIVP